jgi:hypothetical protein
MSQAQVQEDRRLVPEEAFFEYLRSNKELAQKVVDDLIDNIRTTVWSKQNINDGIKSVFLINLGEASEAFRLLRTAAEVAEYTEDHVNLKKLNEALSGFIKGLIILYYNIKEDREPFNEVWRDLYYSLVLPFTELLDESIKDLGDRISTLKSKKS